MRTAPARGFTLIEVIVAISILAIAMTAAFQVATSGLELTARGNEQRALMMRARSLLDEVWARGPLEPGVQEGMFEDGSAWRVRVEPFGADWAAVTHGSRAALYDVTVDIVPARGAPVHLRTVRLSR